MGLERHDDHGRDLRDRHPVPADSDCAGLVGLAAAMCARVVQETFELAREREEGKVAHLQIKCDDCGATCWTKGYIEEVTNAVIYNEDDPLEDACEHIQQGGAWTVINEEYDDGGL
jgi:hypothetical protein